MFHTVVFVAVDWTGAQRVDIDPGLLPDSPLHGFMAIKIHVQDYTMRSNFRVAGHYFYVYYTYTLEKIMND